MFGVFDRYGYCISVTENAEEARTFLLRSENLAPDTSPDLAFGFIEEVDSNFDMHEHNREVARRISDR